MYNKENLLNPYFVVYGNVVEKKVKKTKKDVKFGEDDEEEKSSGFNPILIILVCGPNLANATAHSSQLRWSSLLLVHISSSSNNRANREVSADCPSIRPHPLADLESSWIAKVFGTLPLAG